MINTEDVPSAEVFQAWKDGREIEYRARNDKNAQWIRADLMRDSVTEPEAWDQWEFRALHKEFFAGNFFEDRIGKSLVLLAFVGNYEMALIDIKEGNRVSSPIKVAPFEGQSLGVTHETWEKLTAGRPDDFRKVSCKITYS